MRTNSRPSLQLIADGVMASYIHDISERRRHGAEVTPAPRRGLLPRHPPEARCGEDRVRVSRTRDGTASRPAVQPA